MEGTNTSVSVAFLTLLGLLDLLGLVLVDDSVVLEVALLNSDFGFSLDVIAKGANSERVSNGYR
jgi:hypothetical protein